MINNDSTQLKNHMVILSFGSDFSVPDVHTFSLSCMDWFKHNHNIHSETYNTKENFATKIVG